MGWDPYEIMNTIVILTIVIALLFDFMNGRNDAANSIATIVSTKVLPPLVAVAWAAFFNFAAVFFFGVHVATTVGKGIVDPSVLNVYIIMGGLIGAIIWIYSCSLLGLPISVSHSLIGGLMGPAVLTGGWGVIIKTGLSKVLAFIVLGPTIGVVLGFLIMTGTLYIFRNTAPRRVDSLFRGLQLFSSAIFSLGHGANDAQKTMGIIAVLLFITGHLGPEFYVPKWVIFACYTSISLGTLTGGWRVIKTLGSRLAHIKPVQGFCSETAGAMIIICSSLAGIPLSTTHTITGSITGVVMTKRLSAIRWSIARNIVIAWIITIPTSMVISAACYSLINWIFL